MTQQLQSALRAQIKSISAGYAFSRLGGLATALFLAATGMHAAPLVILPNAIAREYFGLSYAIYVQNITTVGTLNYKNYNGQPGCGGSCIATTQLGADPFASLTVNEVVFNNGSGGGALSWLGYYVEYVNSPGTYMVNLHAAESLSVGDGISQATAYLAFGQASGVTQELEWAGEGGGLVQLNTDHLIDDLIPLRFFECPRQFPSELLHRERPLWPRYNTWLVGRELGRICVSKKFMDHRYPVRCRVLMSTVK